MPTQREREEASEFCHQSLESVKLSFMYSTFLPSQVSQLKKPTAVALAQQIERQSIFLPQVGQASGSVLYKIKNCGHVPQFEQSEANQLIISSPFVVDLI
jgi:pimeloyl-ACP methyl ester carboxylesterase